MRSYLECVPCFAAQAVGTIERFSPNARTREALVRETCKMISRVDFDQSPPAMGQRIHRAIRRLTGKADPYRAIKRESNRLALSLLPAARRDIRPSSDPFLLAVQFVIAANIIDFGKNTNLTRAEILHSIERCAHAPVDTAAVHRLRRAIKRAGSILYLGDNAGEIVFDRLLLEQMPCNKVTYAVRGAPIINDAIMRDARVAGLHRIVKVIDNGSDAPGTILGDCSQSFRRTFNKTDLVISKGQGNYETLSDIRHPAIYFLLQVKCPVVARDTGQAIGSFVVTSNRKRAGS